MKKITLVIMLIVFGRNLFGQDTLQFKPIALKKLVAFEKSLSSEPKGIQFFNPYYDEDFEDEDDESQYNI